MRFSPTADAAPPNVARYVTLAGLCYQLPGVCRVLGGDAAGVQAAVARRSLIALDDEPVGPLFPVWQFPHGRLLPHLGSTMAALPLDLMGLWEAALWVTRPRRSLHGDCAAGWLARGGDPDVVRSLAPIRTRADEGTSAEKTLEQLE